MKGVAPVAIVDGSRPAEEIKQRNASEPRALHGLRQAVCTIWYN
jgi:hypothetical protein